MIYQSYPPLFDGHVRTRSVEAITHQQLSGTRTMIRQIANGRMREVEVSSLFMERELQILSSQLKIANRIPVRHV